MSNTHYKLPLDDVIDKDIIDWINSFPRNKKGELVRHAIRYYMATVNKGDNILFPNAVVAVPRDREDMYTEPQTTKDSKVDGKKERKKPKFNPKALVGES